MIFKNKGKAFIVLFIGLFLTLVATIYTYNDSEIQSKKEFNAICGEIRTKIAVRMQAHEQILRATSAFVESLDTMTRAGWREFHRGANVFNELPGIQGIGYAEIVQKDQLKEHLGKIRKEGYPDYAIRPEGDRSFYTTIVYIEPFKDRNLRAFGYDMFTEPIRRKAMEISRDSDIYSLSGKVTLVQETDKDLQAGTLMYIPVYMHGQNPQTVEQRRANITGWIYSAYRMNDLMQGVLGRWDLDKKARIHLRIYDNDISKNSLMYDSQIVDDIAYPDNPKREEMFNLQFNGAKWVLYFSQEYSQTVLLQGKTIVILLSGLIICLLLFSLFLTLIDTRLRAQKIAEKLTKDLKDSEAKLKGSEIKFNLLLNSATEAIYEIDLQGKCVYCNKSALRILGFTEMSEVIGKNMHDLIHHSYADGTVYQEHECKIFKAFKEGKGSHVDDEVLWTRNGTSFPSEYWSDPILLDGKLIGAVVTFIDIAERKKYEEKVHESETNFRTFFETMDDMIFIGNQRGEIFYTNSNTSEKLGYTLEELLGIPILDLHQKSKKQEAENIFSEMFEGRLNSCPLPLMKKDGSLIPVETRIWMGTWNDKECIFGISKDLSKEQEALQKFNKMFNSNPALMAVSTISDQKFTEVNLSFLKTLGYSKEEILGKSSSDLELFSDLKEQEEAARQLIEAGSIRNIEIKVRTKSGKILTGLFSGEVIESQGIQYLLTVMVDISELKLVENELKIQSGLITSLLDSIPDIIFYKDVNGVYLGCNPSFAEFTGFERTQIIGKTDYDLFGKEVADYFKEYDKKMFEVMQPRHNEEWITYPNGRRSLLDTLKTPYIDHDGSLIGILGISRDITERKKSEEELKNMAAFQQILMNMASEYINLGITEIEKGIGQSLAELGAFIGADFATIFFFDWTNDNARLTHDWSAKGQLLQKNQLNNIPLNSLRHWTDLHVNGETIYVPDVLSLPEEDGLRRILLQQGIMSFISIPMMDNEKCIGFIAIDSLLPNRNYSENEKNLLLVFAQILVNLNKRSQLEMSLVREKEKANEANKAKSEFLASMSHEIRTPMNSILGFSEVMMNTTKDPKQKNYLKTILESGRTLLSLINDILDLSKIEAGRLEITAEPTNIKMIIEEITHLFHQRCKEKNLDLYKELDEYFPKNILFDEVRFRQIVLNLMGNAIKFTHDGFVKIEVKLRNDINGVIDFDLAVIDSGIGISESDQLRIFESFTQQSGQDSRKYGGTGLGLTICKRLCELMHGEISLHSIPGKGSRFTISFTGVKQSDEEVEEQYEYMWEEETIRFKGSKILIVDDIANNRALALEYLDNFDLKIYEAETGGMAIESAKTLLPDLILMDIRMPGIDGYEATRIIKDDKITAGIPIVALTASTMQSEIDEYVHLFDGYLRKPMHKKSLINEMIRHIPWEKFHYAVDDVAQKTDKNANDDPLKIDIELKEKFQNDFFDAINSQIGFITMDEISQLAENLKLFAHDYSIAMLEVKSLELVKQIEAFDFEQIQKCLHCVKEMFSDETFKNSGLS